MHSREKRGIFGNSMNMVSFGMTPTMPPNAKQSNGFYYESDASLKYRIRLKPSGGTGPPLSVTVK